MRQVREVPGWARPEPWSSLTLAESIEYYPYAFRPERSIRTQLEKHRARLFFCGGVPEWLKGTGCKPVGYAYPGSNPGAPTSDLPALWP